ncbi:hypothetical protein F2P81_013311 [Scophthalmus maximus]|uniref:Uncharacterized protein n=1 Tax=Scophthalmus maximus TaxID=52904 RepID=A0A6A4SNI9_SCOMX|nr:hypothetical protein F2P81_013311 [Scophthalmus maximus]
MAQSQGPINGLDLMHDSPQLQTCEEPVELVFICFNIVSIFSSRPAADNRPEESVPLTRRYNRSLVDAFLIFMDILPHCGIAVRKLPKCLILIIFCSSSPSSGQTWKSRTQRKTDRSRKEPIYFTTASCDLARFHVPENISTVVRKSPDQDLNNNDYLEETNETNQSCMFTTETPSEGLRGVACSNVCVNTSLTNKLEWSASRSSVGRADLCGSTTGTWNSFRSAAAADVPVPGCQHRRNEGERTFSTTEPVINNRLNDCTAITPLLVKDVGLMSGSNVDGVKESGRCHNRTSVSLRLRLSPGRRRGSDCPVVWLTTDPSFKSPGAAAGTISHHERPRPPGSQNPNERTEAECRRVSESSYDSWCQSPSVNLLVCSASVLVSRRT